MAELIVVATVLMAAAIGAARLIVRRTKVEAPGSAGPRRDPLPSDYVQADNPPGSGGGSWRQDNPDSARYRVHLGPGQGPELHWDPFHPRQDRRVRLREARTRPRANRPPGSDYYSLLGVDPSASDREIERAYRSRVSENHPDRFHNDPAGRGAAEERLKQLNAAMQVLRDPIRRSKYDASL